MFTVFLLFLYYIIYLSNNLLIFVFCPCLLFKFPGDLSYIHPIGEMDLSPNAVAVIDSRS